MSSRASFRSASSLAVAVLALASCDPLESLSIPSCSGPLLPDYGGVHFDPAGMVQKRVGEEFRLSARVTRPSVPAPPPGCSSTLEGIVAFHHVSWSWPIDGPIDVELVSCPCRVIRTYDERRGSPSNWTHHVMVEPLGPGEYVFAVRAAAPGLGGLSLAGYLTGPCGTGAPGEPISECGAYSSDIKFVTVVADTAR